MGPTDSKDAIAALERLVSRHHVLSVEEARQAARLITGDPQFEFPPSKEPPPAAAAGDAEPAAPTPPPAPAGETEKDGDGGSAP